MADYLGQRGRFDEVTRHHQAVVAARTPTPTKEQQISTARQNIGSVKVANGKVFTGLLPDADNLTAKAVIDHSRSVRIVDIPDNEHPQTHTLRIMNLETPDGVEHAAILQINNKTHEVERVFVNMDKEGNADRIGKGLANSQSEMLNPDSGLHFTHYTIEPLEEKHKGVIRDINSSIDKLYDGHPQMGKDGKLEVSNPLPIDPRDGKIDTTQTSPTAQSKHTLTSNYKGLTPTHGEASNQGSKAPDITRHNKNIRPH